MSYKNGKEVLPPSLLKEMQKYIQGELVYIPKENSQRAGWGEVSGARDFILNRNKEMYQLYCTGSTLAELERKYHLSIDSIRKIIYQTRTLHHK